MLEPGMKKTHCLGCGMEVKIPKRTYYCSKKCKIASQRKIMPIPVEKSMGDGQRRVIRKKIEDG